jgi:integrase
LRPGPADPGAYTDADYTISAGTARDLIEAVPENTRKAYGRAWARFETWCTATGRQPLPATPHTLTEFVRTMLLTDSAPASVAQMIGIIRSRHREAGFPDQPVTLQARRLLKDYRKRWAAEGGRVRRRDPVLVPDLRAMAKTCGAGLPAAERRPIDLRDHALLTLGVNLMARESTLVALDTHDIKFVAEQGLITFIAFSKTDQEAKGREVAVPYGQYEATCAVRAVRAWIEFLASRGITSGPLFRSVDQHGRTGGEPRAIISTPRLDGESVDKIVKARAKAAGLKNAGKMGGHSLRAGGATIAAMAGKPALMIAEQGGWSADSPTVMIYVRASFDDNVMKGVGL